MFDAAMMNDGFSQYIPEEKALPEDEAITQTVDAVCNEFADMAQDTALEPVIAEVLTRFTSQIHSLMTSHQRMRDAKELEAKDLQSAQDGSEILSYKLETLHAEMKHADQLIEAIELMRDRFAQNHRTITGSAWAPASGSKTSRKTMTAAILEVQDYVRQEDRAKVMRQTPEGPKVAVTGTQGYTDVAKVHEVLNSLHAKQPSMVLLHGGLNKGVDRIAANWAADKNVPSIIVKPDFKAHAKAAPFKRNDKVLELAPKVVVSFINTGDKFGVAKNLTDKAREAGITNRTYKQEAAQ